jgi:hypothetical protein
VRTWRARVLLIGILTLAACAHGLRLREPVASTVEFVPSGDGAYATADPAGATGKPGEGKVIRPYVVRVTRDVKVYRLWDGPDVRDAQGRTSRMGQWWTFEPPSGTLASFRTRYEVCEKWDTLRWVAACTLRRGAVVVIGAGQSVSAQVCGDATRRENYPRNDRDLQVYIREAWTRTDLTCPDEREDYQNDPRDISKRAN